jgi:RNA polymerase sigma factor (sigma-70 family)
MAVIAQSLVDRQEVDYSFVIDGSDDHLVAQVRAGNDAAFEAIYDRYARKVLSFCVHLLGRREDAEDALQLTFVSAYRALRQTDGDISLRPWLFTIARNRCLSELRAGREAFHAAGELTDRPCFDAPPDEVQRQEDVRELFDDLKRLPHDQRAALVLFELGDHPHAEIAEVLGVRTEKVKALIFQAREALARSRSARNSPCAEVRELLATVRGKVLPRSMTRAHIDRCPGCAAFEDKVRGQRAALALILPVAMSGHLKALVLGSALSGGKGLAAAGAGTGGGGAVLTGGGAVGSGTAAGAAGTASTVGTLGTVAASTTAAGTLGAAAGTLGAAGAVAAGFVAAGGGAPAAAGLAAHSGIGLIAKVAIAAMALTTGALGTALNPHALLPPSPLISGRPAALTANTALPSVSGSAVQGSTLTASQGSWSGSPASFAYQWQDCDSGGANCSAIAGATSSSYTLGASDVGSTVEVVVTASNGAGSASAVSSPTGVVTAPATPVSNTAAPLVSGSAVQGSTLTASDGTWSGSPAPTFAYQWEDCDAGGGNCAPIAGATSSTYVLAGTDVGSTVVVVVTATNSAGSASAASSPTGVVSAAATAVSNTAAPLVSGSAVQGSTLTASQGSWSGSPATFAYQWQDCDSGGTNCTPIAGATSSSYTLAASDVGLTVEVVVTATNTAGSASASASSPTALIAAAPANTPQARRHRKRRVKTDSVRPA